VSTLLTSHAAYPMHLSGCVSLGNQGSQGWASPPLLTWGRAGEEMICRPEAGHYQVKASCPPGTKALACYPCSGHACYLN
jgi:hypothetical protein